MGGLTVSALTPAQERYLAEIRAAGTKVYNGRARKVIEALEAAGLVTVDWDRRAQAKGNGIELTEVITVVATQVAGDVG